MLTRLLKYIFLIVFLLFDSLLVFSADKKHVKKLDASSVKNEINELSSLQDKAEFEDKYRKLYNQAKELGLKEDVYQDMIYQRLMFYYYNEMNTDTIGKYVADLGNYYRRNKDNYNYYYIYCALADAYITNGNVKRGIEVGKSMLEIAKKNKENIGIALSGHALAMAYMTMQDYRKAELHFNQAIPIMKREKRWSLYAISSCNYLGVLIDQEKYKQAKKVFVELNSIADASAKSKEPFINSVVTLYIKSIEASQLYLGLGDAKTMKKYKDYVENFYQLNPDMPKEYLYQMRIRYAEVTKNSKERLKCADSLLSIYDSDMSNRYRIYKNKSEALEDIGDYKEALRYLKMYQIDKDSMNSKDSREMTAQLSAEYDNLHLELDRRNLELKVKDQQVNISLIVIFGSAFFIIVILIFTLYLMNLNKKLNRSLKVKDDFIHHITHEIRTPLNYMVGFGELIYQKYENDDEETKFMVDEMNKGSKELLKMITDMLIISDIESGKISDKKSDVDIRQLCQDEIDKANINIKNDVELQFSCDEMVDKCFSSHFLLSYIIENLLDNAAKYTTKGIISIDCRKNSEGRCLISVFNSGKALNSEDERVVFSRFGKLNEFGQGLGLGLYISRKYAKSIGAQLSLNTSRTDGVEFVLVI